MGIERTTDFVGSDFVNILIGQPAAMETAKADEGSAGDMVDSTPGMCCGFTARRTTSEPSTQAVAEVHVPMPGHFLE